jgi:hypothetical protein
MEKNLAIAVLKQPNYLFCSSQDMAQKKLLLNIGLTSKYVLIIF